jgi:hypothetical protein
MFRQLVFISAAAPAVDCLSEMKVSMRQNLTVSCGLVRAISAACWVPNACGGESPLRKWPSTDTPGWISSKMPRRLPGFLLFSDYSGPLNTKNTPAAINAKPARWLRVNDAFKYSTENTAKTRRVMTSCMVFSWAGV